MPSHQSKRDESKHDEDQERRERSFHWPPTSEELESIQVVAMSDLAREAQHRTPSHAMVRATLSQRTRLAKLAHDRDQKPVAPPPPASRRWFDGSVAAQAGLVAASMAAIGVAATSLLSPAQPTSAHHGATTAPSAITASAHAPEPAIAFPIASVSPRSPKAEAQPVADAARTANGAAYSVASTAASQPREAVEPAAVSTRTARGNARADTRPLAWNWKVAEHKATPARHGSVEARPAGSDPVSRFATKTGSGVWKVMRAVGRSFKRSDEPALESRAPTRSAGAHRMAAAIDLEAANDLSDR